ncbi:MAG: pseudouridine synthase [Anaerolineae bacterium]|nr:pseudouridine synthase [Anaerolineae bacterium]MDQ7035542.1 pseudouridine synthase [Anaerolineae bacterium]
MPTIKFWKPYRVLTQFTDDEEGRETLADYIDIPNIYAAGRLDYDSEGLMILTDDGNLNHKLTHPKHGHPRTYWAQVENIPDEEALNKIRRGGMAIKNYKTRPAQARIIEEPVLPKRNPPIRYRANIPDCWLELILTEGKKRQVRRMTAAVGHPTLRLVRAAIGTMTLDGMEQGKWLELTDAEMQALWRSIKGSL